MNEQHWLFCLCYSLRKPHWLKLLFLKFLFNSDLSLPQDDIELCSFFFLNLIQLSLYVSKDIQTIAIFQWGLMLKYFLINLRHLLTTWKRGFRDSVEIIYIIATILSYQNAWCRKTGLLVEVKRGVKWNLIFILGVFYLLYNSTVW